VCFLLLLASTFVEQERLLEVNKGSSNGTGASKFWQSSILGDAMRIVFQNLLLEANDNILQSSESVWRLLLLVF
jgi:TATA-binding protein-associated factor